MISIDFLNEQFDKILETSKKASKAGKLSAQKRRAKAQEMLNNCSTSVQQPLNECSTDKIREEKIDNIYNTFVAEVKNGEHAQAIEQWYMRLKIREGTLTPLLKEHHKKALILGTGGASKAIAFALQKLNIECKFVSRKVSETSYLYSMLTEDILNKYSIIVNCSPIGTHPNIEDAPNIPYQFISEKHLLYDLIYNPFETKFLQEGKRRGAQIKNGLEMLELQAEKSWEIWNKS